MKNKNKIILIFCVMSLTVFGKKLGVENEIKKIELNDKGVSNVQTLNSSQESARVSILPKADPESVGFSKEGLEKVDQLIQQEITGGFPGAVLLIVKDGKIVKNTAYGYAKKYDSTGKELQNPEKMETTKLFDMASNTKMYATNYAIMKLVSEGKINVESRVSEYIPGYGGEGREKILVKDLLTHSAGYAPEVKFYEPEATQIISKEFEYALGRNFYSKEKSKTENIIIRDVPLDYERGTKTVYSDTDYMLLGIIVEKVTEQSLDEYVENEIYKPLGLNNTMYNPLKKGKIASDAAATELSGNTRDGYINFPGVRRNVIQGEVHDEKAYYSMNGVSGHAGLFSTSEDLAVLMSAMLNDGMIGNTRLFNKNVMDQFTKASEKDITFGLGWRRAGENNLTETFGTLASSEAIGHTGWTGTVTVIDPKYNLEIVLLTNKKHSPVIKNLKEKNGKPNFNKFQGDIYETGKYGQVITKIYEAFLDKNKVNEKPSAEPIKK